MRLLSLFLVSALFLSPTPSNAPSPDAGPTSMGGRPDSLFVDADASSIRWTSAPDRASGVVTMRSGVIVIRHERIEGGRLVADLSSMRGRISNVSLGAPIRSPYITQLVLRDGEHIGNGDYRLAGELTIHGVSKPVSFQAHASWPETGHLVAEGHYTLRPDEWGVQGDAAREPMTIDVSLHARRRPPRVASR